MRDDSGPLVIRRLGVAALVLCAAAGLSACSAGTPASISQDAAFADHRALYNEFLQIVRIEFENVEFSNRWEEFSEGGYALYDCTGDGTTVRYSNIPNARFLSELAPQDVADLFVSLYNDSDIELKAAKVDDGEPEHAGDFTFESHLRGKTPLGTEVWIEVYGVQADDYNVSVFLHTDTQCFTANEDSE